MSAAIFIPRPGGSSGQLQFNASGLFGGAAFSSVAASGNLLTLTAQADADVPLTLKAHSAGQSGDYLQCLASDGTTVRARVGPNGIVQSSFLDASTPGFSLNGDGNAPSGMGLFNGLFFWHDGFLSVVVSDPLKYVRVASTYQYTFCSLSNNAGPADAGLSRAAAGVVGVTDGSTGYGSLICGSPSQAANTSADGLTLLNPLPATSGNQRWSPRTRWSAQGFKTTSVAGSQQVDFIAEVQTVQGTTSPSGNLVFSSQINGGGYIPVVKLSSEGNIAAGSGAGSGNSYGHTFISDLATGMWLNGAGNLAFTTNNSCIVHMNVGGVRVHAAVGLNWSSGDPSSVGADAGLSRVGAGIVGVTNGVGGQGYIATASAAADPTPSDIPAGSWMVWKNTMGGGLALWANDGGTMRSVTLT